MEGSSRKSSTSAPHGIKRQAEDELRDDQRLAKRFDLLHIDRNGKIRIPLPSSQNHSCLSSSSIGTSSDDSMQLDDTKDKIYIHNLEDQIAEIEDQEKMIFLPDIEEKLGKIPQYLLSGNLRPTAENQMVLYGAPASLSLPEERDNVRKAILESRARAREKLLHDDEHGSMTVDPTRNGVSYVGEHHVASHSPQAQPEEMEDAMDLG